MQTALNGITRTLVGVGPTLNSQFSQPSFACIVTVLGLKCNAKTRHFAYVSHSFGLDY